MVMADLKTFYSEMLRMNERTNSTASVPWKSIAEYSIPPLMGREDLLDCSTTCLCKVCNERTERAETKARSEKAPLFEEYNNIKTLNVANKTLTDHMYLLCPNQISVFAFQTRTWGMKDPIPYTRYHDFQGTVPRLTRAQRESTSKTLDHRGSTAV
jgi:hypothetical protein